ncbi:MAG: hypothetical protein AAGF73_06080 [Actinomycetota bacterium]
MDDWAKLLTALSAAGVLTFVATLWNSRRRSLASDSMLTDSAVGLIDRYEKRLAPAEARIDEQEEEIAVLRREVSALLAQLRELGHEPRTDLQQGGPSGLQQGGPSG